MCNSFSFFVLLSCFIVIRHPSLIIHFPQDSEQAPQRSRPSKPWSRLRKIVQRKRRHFPHWRRLWRHRSKRRVFEQRRTAWRHRREKRPEVVRPREVQERSLEGDWRHCQGRSNVSCQRILGQLWKNELEVCKNTLTSRYLSCQRILAYFLRESITVRLTSSFTCLTFIEF